MPVGGQDGGDSAGVPTMRFRLGGGGVWRSGRFGGDKPGGRDGRADEDGLRGWVRLPVPLGLAERGAGADEGNAMVGNGAEAGAKYAAGGGKHCDETAREGDRGADALLGGPSDDMAIIGSDWYGRDGRTGDRDGADRDSGSGWTGCVRPALQDQQGLPR